MEAKFILAVCKNCPHARLVGGEPPNWRKQTCHYHVDNAEATAGKTVKEVRSTIEIQDLRDLEECPDKPRAARHSGAI